MKKIFITIVAATIIFLAVGFNVKAAESFTPPADLSYYTHTLAYYDTDGVLTMYSFSGCPYYNPYINGGYIGRQSTQLQFSYYQHRYSGGQWHSTYSSSTSDSVINGNVEIVYSNFDIIDWSSGDVFFSKLLPEVPEKTLLKIMETVKMSEVLTQIVVMIPIGMACLVGFLALRKALSLLQQILHKA